ncbi:MAG: N-acetylmuramoyl-L-alanine amidase [Syntrophomonadaceae bacterium]|jgi:N-acetylmuramoyl-L-alanine amidase
MFKGKVFLISRRKAILAITGVFTLAVLFMLVPAQPLKEQAVLSYGVANKVIVIDPGHGGLDQGATRGNYVESDITLQISKKLASYLSQAGARVIMLRENESDLAGDEFTGTIGQHKREDMKKRVEKANKAQADLYVSIHTNAVPNSVWTGAQTFYKPKCEFSKQVATTVQEELINILGNTKRKAAPGSYFVLNNSEMTAILIECGFISNLGEAALLADSSYQSKLAYAIFSGIARSQIGN